MNENICVTHLTAAQKEAIITYFEPFLTPYKWQHILEILALRTRFLTVMLEDIYQPHNASAILRSAECFGVQDVHIVEQEYQYRVSRDIARGAAQWLTLQRYTDTQVCLMQLQAAGYKIVATSLRPGAMTLAELPLTEKLVLCFGTEQKGLTNQLHEAADYWLKIPMMGFTRSFNVSVSAALCLYECTGRLRHSQAAWGLTEPEKQDLQLEWILKSCNSGRPLLARLFKQEGWEGLDEVWPLSKEVESSK